MPYADDFLTALDAYLDARRSVDGLAGQSVSGRYRTDRRDNAREALRAILGRAFASPSAEELRAMVAEDAKWCGYFADGVRCARARHDDDVHDFKSGTRR